MLGSVRVTQKGEQFSSQLLDFCVCSGSEKTAFWKHSICKKQNVIVMIYKVNAFSWVTWGQSGEVEK